MYHLSYFLYHPLYPPLSIPMVVPSLQSRVFPPKYTMENAFRYNEVYLSFGTMKARVAPTLRNLGNKDCGRSIPPCVEANSFR